MERMIIVSLPVRHLGAARAFYAGLGFAVNEACSDDDVVCVVVSDAICVMLLERARFALLTSLPVADARTSTQVLHCLTARSRDEVDALVRGAVASGGAEPRAAQQGGGVYARTVTDPDGHVWEILHTDLPAAG